MNGLIGGQTVPDFARDWLNEPVSLGMIERGIVAPPFGEPLNFWERLAGPWVDAGESLWTGTGQVFDRINERLPDLLFEKLGLTERTVREGPDRTVTFVQPEHPGGLPAQGPLVILPDRLAGMLPPQVRETLGSSTGILIAVGIGLVVLFAVKK